MGSKPNVNNNSSAIKIIDTFGFAHALHDTNCEKSQIRGAKK